MMNTVCEICVIVLCWGSDTASVVVVHARTATCVHAQPPSDVVHMLTGENHWQDSRWCPLTAFYQSLPLITRHFHLDNSQPRGATLESPWVFKVFTLTLHASVHKVRLLVDNKGRLDTCWVIIIRLGMLAAPCFIIQLCAGGQAAVDSCQVSWWAGR